MREKYPDAVFGLVNIKRDYRWPKVCNREWSNGQYVPAACGKEDHDGCDVDDHGWEIYLGHSCDEWVIGSPNDAEEMSNNLLEAIAYARKNP